MGFEEPEKLKQRSIGVIDSGIGGLTLLDRLIARRVIADYWYCSDGKNVPYGEKNQDFIKKQMIEMVDRLCEKGVVQILIACNTATAETINELREKFQVPFVGIEPYINYLHVNKESKGKKMALILTEATYRSKRFQDLRSKLDPSGEIDIFPLKHLAMLIESMKQKKFSDLRELIDKELGPLRENSYDSLILGCTHYPIIKKYLADFLKCEIIDPSESVVNRVVSFFNLKISETRLSPSFSYSEDAGLSWQTTKIQDFSFLYR